MDPMQIKDNDAYMLCHDFKIVAENTLNIVEKILTIYKEEKWTNIDGISSGGLDGNGLAGSFYLKAY